MRLLVVGGGSIGRRHLANLRLLEPSAHITLWRPHSSPVQSAADTMIGADRVVYTEIDALACAYDAAVVATAASSHVDIGLTLARHGIALMIEKPISDNLARARQLTDICGELGLPLLVGYNLRFYPPLRVMREALLNGDIGRLMCLRAEVGQYLPEWRPGSDYRQGVSSKSELGGGVVLELSHELDYVTWMVGGVRSVMAQIGRLSDLEIDVEDTAEILLRFEGGVIGSVHLDMTQRAMTRRCRLVGTEGSLEWDASSNAVQIYTSRSKEWCILHPPSALVRNDMYIDEMRHFLACARRHESPAITGEDGLRVLQLALAVKESAREAKAITMDRFEVSKPNAWN